MSTDAQLDLLALARERQDEAQAGREERLAAETLTSLLLETQDALQGLCPDCREGFEARLAEAPLWSARTTPTGRTNP